MKYRKLGRTGLDVSEIGMGLEHLLPKDEATVIETIKAAINGGVNYFDCLSQKDFENNSDTNEQYTKLGKALNGVRDKVYINYLANANKSDKDDFMDGLKIGFECFLREVKTDYVDIFMIAFCDKIIEFDRVMGDGGLLEYAKKLRDEKKVKFIALSTHSCDIALKVIESGEIDVLMYPVNPAFDVITNEKEYMEKDLGKLWDAAYDYKSAENSDIQPRKNVYTECLKNNIGLVVMKPFGGGFLFREDINTGFTPLNLISYALTQTGVSTVVPGCTSPQQIEEILSYYTCPENALDFSQAVSNSRWNIKGNCQYCNHCLPCPLGMNIGEINRAIDNKAADDYNKLDKKASSCVKCGECEDRCPFGVKVTERMELAANMFE
jgi:predicted aldo/keto reductase-like oxidoreductase